MAQLVETVYMSKRPVVNRESGTISGVKLLGAESKNGRRYSEKAMKSASRLYVGAKNFIDHDRESEERGLADWASIITEAHVESDGVFGTLKLRKQSPHYAPLMEAAEDPDFHKAFGMSHVAEGSTKLDGSTELVEDVTEVLSVDFVTSPATTKALSESARRQRRPIASKTVKATLESLKTIKATLESLPVTPVRKRLVEMLGDGADAGGLNVGKGDMPNDALGQMATIANTLIAMLGDTLKALAAKPDPAAAAPAIPGADPNQPPAEESNSNPFGEESPDGDDPEDPSKTEGTPMTPEEKTKMDGLRRENAELKAKNLLLESGREATAVRIKALASAAEADRKALLESWPVKAAGKTERPASSPPMYESGDSELTYEKGDLKKLSLARR